MTPEEHYARGIDLLDLAERSTEMFQIQANAVLAQTHFSAAAAGAGMRSMADYLEVERDRIAAADHHARPAEAYEGPAGLRMHRDDRGVWRWDAVGDGPSARNGAPQTAEPAAGHPARLAAESTEVSWCHCVEAGYPGPHRRAEGCEVQQNREMRQSMNADGEL